MGVKIQNEKGTPTGVAIWNNPTNFHENRTIPSVQNLVYRQTDTHMDRHYVKTTFFVSENPKMDISTKISKSNFWTITILSLL